MSADVSGLWFSSRKGFFLFVVLKTLVQVILVYANLLVLYPLLFKRKKYFLYVLVVLLITLIAGYGNTRVEGNILHLTFKGQQDYFFYFISQFGMAGRYVIISFLLQITVDYYLQKELIKKIELEKTTAELNFLKAQVNPHFLFNTLNNLYALILEKSDKSGEAVLKLADIMKYILAEGKENKVMLQKEIDLLYNYTELERLRKPEAEIIFHTSGNTSNHFITPLLLLPLVENAFKYGLNSVSKNGFVRINIVAETGMLYVTVENNVPPINNNNALKSLGLGIENVNRRLEMLYPGNNVFKIENKIDSYFVQLKIQLS